MSGAGSLRPEDVEHLRWLSVGHYVVAGLQALFGCFPVLHLGFGLFMLFVPPAGMSKGGPPPQLFGAIFVAVALAWMGAAWAMAVALFVAGRNLARRTRRTYCMVVAIVAAAFCMPLGTVLGIFTIIVLLRPEVAAAFGEPSGARAAS